ncbi:MAG: cytochrome b/b6 domain-containing protein [Marinicella pacifica]
MPDYKTYPVWDAGTRWFHWVNFICVVGLSFIGLIILNGDFFQPTTQTKINLKVVHVWIGYVFALNLLWRMVWAFFGNRHARWRAILPGGRGYFAAVRSYIGSFIKGSPEFYIGHNPVGKIAILLLMLALIVQAVTGLVLAGTDVFYPPLGGYFADWIAADGVTPADILPYAPELYNEAAYQSMRAFRKPFITVHLYNFYVLSGLIFLHVFAVVMSEIKGEGDIISAMFSGRKISEQQPKDQVREKTNE